MAQARTLFGPVITDPHMMFGPVRVTGHDDGETIWLIGLEPDDAFWDPQG